jgi:hypothetical protein
LKRPHERKAFKNTTAGGARKKIKRATFEQGTFRGRKARDASGGEGGAGTKPREKTNKKQIR